MRVHVYVGGFNLYYRALRGPRHRWLNLDLLARRRVRPGDTVELVRGGAFGAYRSQRTLHAHLEGSWLGARDSSRAHELMATAFSISEAMSAKELFRGHDLGNSAPQILCIGRKDSGKCFWRLFLAFIGLQSGQCLTFGKH